MEGVHFRLAAGERWEGLLVRVDEYPGRHLDSQNIIGVWVWYLKVITELLCFMRCRACEILRCEGEEQAEVRLELLTETSVGCSRRRVITCLKWASQNT